LPGDTDSAPDGSLWFAVYPTHHNFLCASWKASQPLPYIVHQVRRCPRWVWLPVVLNVDGVGFAIGAAGLQ
jgi:hypothetical protein